MSNLHTVVENAAAELETVSKKLSHATEGQLKSHAGEISAAAANLAANLRAALAADVPAAKTSANASAGEAAPSATSNGPKVPQAKPLTPLVRK